VFELKYSKEEEEDLIKCSKCGITERETMLLEKCPMCYKIFCSNCKVTFGGREFCSKICGQFFFFGEDE